MTGDELINIMHQSHQRVHVTGTTENGIVAALDLEGRLFAVVNNKVLNRVMPEALVNHSNRNNYFNPGGDTLWPAPEGSCFGYEYGTGKWRVPPAITGAVWEVVEQSERKSVIRAEIDLINNLQIGIPCEFERKIEIEEYKKSLTQKVTEIIRYIGNRTLVKDEFRLAPWSLCQFDSGDEGKVIMPPPSSADIRDLYSSSLMHRGIIDDKYVVKTKTDFRFQLGLGENVPWIEFVSGNDFSVKRYTGVLPHGQIYIDIADTAPDQFPSNNGIRLSMYSDPSGFMEIEACGGCPDILTPGTELSVDIITEYTINNNDGL